MFIIKWRSIKNGYGAKKIKTAESPGCTKIQDRGIIMKVCNHCGKELIRRKSERKDHFAKRKYCNSSCANAATQGDKNRARKDMRTGNYEMKHCIRCFELFPQFNQSQGKCNACVQLDGTKHDNFGPVYSHPRDRWLYPLRNV